MEFYQIGTSLKIELFFFNLPYATLFITQNKCPYAIIQYGTHSLAIPPNIQIYTIKLLDIKSLSESRHAHKTLRSTVTYDGCPNRNVYLITPVKLRNKN